MKKLCTLLLVSAISTGSFATQQSEISLDAIKQDVVILKKAGEELQTCRNQGASANKKKQEQAALITKATTQAKQALETLNNITL